jgi:hypothetical protein
VLRIHDILVEWIWILLFSSLTFKAKKFFFSFLSFSTYYFLKVHLHHFSKIKKAKRSHKTVEIMVFLTILLHDRRFRIWDPDPDEPKNVWIWDLLAHLWYF